MCPEMRHHHMKSPWGYSAVLGADQRRKMGLEHNTDAKPPIVVPVEMSNKEAVGQVLEDGTRRTVETGTTTMRQNASGTGTRTRSKTMSHLSV